MLPATQKELTVGYCQLVEDAAQRACFASGSRGGCRSSLGPGALATWPGCTGSLVQGLADLGDTGLHAVGEGVCRAVGR
jgi:hypothetical protein